MDVLAICILSFFVPSYSKRVDSAIDQLPLTADIKFILWWDERWREYQTCGLNFKTAH